MDYTIMDYVEDLSQKPCYIMDYLPEQVPAGSPGQFFEVEWYLLNQAPAQDLRDRFTRVLLKAMCYWHMLVLWDGVQDQPKPEVVADAVKTIMDCHSGSLYMVLPEEDCMFLFEWDCLNLTVYNPSPAVVRILEKLAPSEGLFWRKAAQ